MHTGFSGFVGGGRRPPQAMCNKFFRLLTTRETTTNLRETITASCPDVIVVQATAIARASKFELLVGQACYNHALLCLCRQIVLMYIT
jgi:hypothetical protein